MNKEELKQKLVELNIKSEFYSLDGESLPDRIVMSQNYDKWDVFYFDERGNRDGEKIFSSESVACNYVYDLLMRQKEIEKKYN
ncbi:hypothetical protein TH53_13660 [Pedobacter lusitanus]|uniref:Uncharacterized protein n=2 Tax=Pedobacter lusitanus TaxID=1503925 RepID=A0A0D0GQ88_9SPHI|nr:hypothetical protein [Pedobacter lusitanus]KIO76716.1 hypothetical protein TH53_13660 [Pedobacter lusitanus]